MTDRMIRAARLDANLYEEVEADTSAMGQAMVVVLLAGAAAGFGSLAEGGVAAFVVNAVASLVGWVVWAFLTYVIGTRLLPQPTTQADMGQMLRTLGFAATPGLLRVLAIVPAIGPLVFLISALWSLAAMVVAVRQALDYDSTARAIVVCLIGWVIQMLIIVLPLVLLGVAGDSEGAPSA